ncbi:related to budding protein BOI2 [Cephalotrichum gorgonifer]|uniref:Related to budding protein BOI2 n=1 Tax=Cephalotrichum gorgonifer TaxID=2041049 RepID=A0AAE8MUD7_9PEZI|nr:related to budding protein BOI2 [Cephalotrichum gorgonifer]
MNNSSNAQPWPPASKPEAGDILVVIHDFNSRSTDELSLAKGDRVELIERDDEFGDGWYLGRHLLNDQTGLFPEVYTRPAPKNAGPTNASTSTNANATSTTTTTTSSLATKPLASTSEPASDQKIPEKNTTSTTIAESTPKVASPSPSIPEQSIATPAASPKANNPPIATLPLTSVAASKPDSAPSSSIEQALARLNNQDSRVLNETLNVIDEHITNLRSPASHGGLNHGALPTITDSGSEYSAPLDHRVSYIQGEETDEEEDASHTRPEVESWNPDEVAEYLFTAGVEKHHCEVFRDQEISGEVLLGMDQSSLFIKALDLGSVGRRLKTWQKIKSLQDEVNSGAFSRRTTQAYGSEAGSEGAKRMRSRTNTLTGSSQKMSTIEDRPTSSTTGGRRSTNTATPRLNSMNLGSPVSPSTIMESVISESPTRTGHNRRPSAAEIRDLHHSRRHSSTDYRGTPVIGAAASPSTAVSGTFSPSTDTPHKKQPSFDRNWTMGNSVPARPLSSTFQDLLGTTPVGVGMSESALDADRGYFSGTEVDGRRKNVLKKRDTGSHAAGLAKTSYAEEQRVRSATAISRHSRYGSIESSRDGAPSQSAVQKYYGIATGQDHRRTASTNTTESVRPAPPAKDHPPAVTRLDTSPSLPQASSAGRHGSHGDWFSSVVNKPVKAAGLGLRAISDSVTPSSERSSIGKGSTPQADSPRKDSPVLSPARTGSTTPSAGHSFDLDADGKALGGTGAKNARKKGKKETSAYTRGLLKVPPRTAMQEADYSGWMRKKSSNLMTMWKPRLFVLKGRRLAYYYSEDDDQEKGLIDISFHRVLPADNEKLTGLHATITGAGGSTPSLGEGGETQLDKGDDSVFIFKLVPPRAGLSRAVNFTKPTVHYFAVPNLKQGRLWMAALMKATIDRDDSQVITTTYQQKTISLAKARAMRHRPPALMGLDDEEAKEQGGKGEADSGISGVEKREDKLITKSMLPMSA